MPEAGNVTRAVKKGNEVRKHFDTKWHRKYMSKMLERQVKLGTSCRVKVPAENGGSPPKV